MGIRINQNIMAMNSYRNLTTSESALSKSLEKLSSGYRINKAADDASGLVISEGLRSQVMGLRMAIKNTQDGISVVQTAEGALTEVHSLLQRIRELAVQAASTGSSDQASRDAAQAEVAQLLDEVDRISNTTKFGGQTLLDGSYGKTVGSDGIEEVLPTDALVTGASVPTAGFRANFTGAGARQFVLSIDDGPAFVVTIDTDNSGAADLTALAASIEADIDAAALAAGRSANDIRVSFTSDSVFGGSSKIVLTGDSGAAGNTIEVSTDGTAAGDTFFESWFGTFSGESKSLRGEGRAFTDAVAGTFGSSDGHAVIQGSGSSNLLRVNFQGAAVKAFELDYNGTGPTTVVFDFDATNMTREEFESAVQAAVDESLVAAGNGAAGDVLFSAIEAGGGDWAFELRTRHAGAGNTLHASDIDGPDFGVGNDNIVSYLFNGSDVGEGEVGTSATYFRGSAAGGGTFQVGASAGESIEFVIGDTDTAALGVNGINVSSDAGSALGLIDDAIDEISVLRGDLGALQNRFEHTINNLSVTMENLSASESRIRDTDMAAEMMQFTRAQILQQAGTAMLAQANALPQGVLQLLQ